MKRIVTWASRIADGIAAAMLAAIFVTFLLQIASRYAPRIVTNLGLADVWPWLGTIAPLGWTLELIGILWVWVIFFACAFVVREYDHVKFDILYLAVPRRVQTVFALLSAVAIAAGMLWAFLPTWDYIDWMKMRRTATVRNPFTDAKIPLRTIFSIYGLFMLAVAARYLIQIVTIWRHGPPQTQLEVAIAEDGDAAPETRT